MSRNAFLEKNAISEVLVNTVQINTHNASQSLWVWILLLSRIVLCLNAFAKLQNVRGAPHQPDLMGKYPTCLYVLALSVYWMVYYQSFPGGVQGMRLCGHERGSSWEESWHEIYASKCTQKYSKHDKEKWWHTNSLDWYEMSWCVRYVTWLQWRKENVRQVKGCFDLRMASKTYQ